jgi:hypothetical protein
LLKLFLSKTIPLVLEPVAANADCPFAAMPAIAAATTRIAANNKNDLFLVFNAMRVIPVLISVVVRVPNYR